MMILLLVGLSIVSVFCEVDLDIQFIPNAGITAEINKKDSHFKGSAQALRGKQNINYS